MISGVLHSINSNLLKCSFDDKIMDPYCDCPIYGCFATKLRIDFPDKTFDGYTGKHLSTKNAVDVNFLSISDSVAHFLPTRLDLLFNLTGLAVEGVLLLKIRYKVFFGLQQLQYLSLGNNYLTVIPFDAFHRLYQLKTIILWNNQIQEISGKVFRRNLKLERIFLNNNHIKFIGYDTFKDLKQLIFVGLNSNKCVTHSYIGTNSIQNLKKEIKIVCENQKESLSETIDKLRKQVRTFRKKNREVLKNMTKPCPW